MLFPGASQIPNLKTKIWSAELLMKPKTGTTVIKDQQENQRIDPTWKFDSTFEFLEGFLPSFNNCLISFVRWKFISSNNCSSIVGAFRAFVNEAIVVILNFN